MPSEPQGATSVVGVGPNGPAPDVATRRALLGAGPDTATAGDVGRRDDRLLEGERAAGSSAGRILPSRSTGRVAEVAA